MSIAFVCLFVVLLLPYVCTSVGKSSAVAARDPYDNHDPRGWYARQTGLAARANAAQQNSFEALAVFTAALFAATLSHASAARIDALALAFAVLRVAYVLAYLGDRAGLRSAVWMTGMLVATALFFASVW